MEVRNIVVVRQRQGSINHVNTIKPNIYIVTKESGSADVLWDQSVSHTMLWCSLSNVSTKYVDISFNLNLWPSVFLRNTFKERNENILFFWSVISLQ